MFSLAIKADVLTFKPHIPMLAEDNTRKGFFDDEQFQGVVEKLPASVQPVARFAYVTGWRIQSEMLPMEWRQVDRKTGEVRLDAGTTKNRAGRVFPFTDQLRELFEGLWQEHETLRQQGTICPYVFQRNGRRIKSLRGRLGDACTAPACPAASRTICAARRCGTWSAAGCRVPWRCSSPATRRRACTAIRDHERSRPAGSRPPARP